MSGTSEPPGARSTMADIDLERLADSYHLRPMSSDAHARATAAADGCSGWLLDIGGGTGSHAATWRGWGRLPVVVDSSPAMLEQARQNEGLTVVQARSQRLPLENDVAALAYFHLSIHYGDWKAALDEAFRVVAPGGRIEVWTIAPDAIERSSLGRWFPRVIEIDTERFPDPRQIAERCRANGSSAEMSRTGESIVRSAREWERAVRGRFVSTLQLLDDTEIDEGLARFAAECPNPESLYRYELELTRVGTVVQTLR